MYCIGCGEMPVSPGGSCVCGTPAVGARFSERALVHSGQGVRIPPVCCCCLSPSDGLSDENLTGSGIGATFSLNIPMPWCAECRAIRRKLGWMRMAMGLAFGLVAYGVSGFWYKGLEGSVEQWSIRVMIGLLLAAPLGWAFAAVLLAPIVPSLRQAGHVGCCDAMGGGASRMTATLRFGNRAFAQIWNDYQASGASNATAVRRAIPKVVRLSDESRPAPSGVGAQAEHQLVADDLRQRSRQAARIHPSTSRRGIDFRTPETGADAAAGALRFVLKECTFGALGIEARYEDGRSTRVAWGDVAEVRVRQLPLEPPFRGVHLLDLLPKEQDNMGVRPLRILPTTRANYASLPGNGVTSLENFRRVAAHVLAMNPDAKCEPESLAFVRERKLAHAFGSISDLSNYDAEFG